MSAPTRTRSAWHILLSTNGPCSMPSVRIKCLPPYDRSVRSVCSRLCLKLDGHTDDVRLYCRRVRFAGSPIYSLLRGVDSRQASLHAMTQTTPHIRKPDMSHKVVPQTTASAGSGRTRSSKHDPSQWSLEQLPKSSGSLCGAEFWGSQNIELADFVYDCPPSLSHGWTTLSRAST